MSHFVHTRLPRETPRGVVWEATSPGDLGNAAALLSNAAEGRAAGHFVIHISLTETPAASSYADLHLKLRAAARNKTLECRIENPWTLMELFRFLEDFDGGNEDGDDCGFVGEKVRNVKLRKPRGGKAGRMAGAKGRRRAKAKSRTARAKDPQAAPARARAS